MRVKIEKKGGKENENGKWRTGICSAPSRLPAERLTVMTLALTLGMADVHDKATRSYNMSRIRGKDTKPEMIVRRFLHANGFRYRLHVKDLPGKPDIVLPKYRTVIFVHGCFWHGHEECKYFKLPGTRTEWCREKIEKNMELRKNLNINKIRPNLNYPFFIFLYKTLTKLNQSLNFISTYFPE